MTRREKNRGLWWLALVATAGSLAACGKGDDKTRTLTLIGRERVLNATDEGGRGATVGDERAGRTTLYDESGRRVGDVHWTMVITAVEGGKPASGLSVSEFRTPKGQIDASGVLELPGNPLSTRQNAATAKLVVLGGTGAYAGARGELDRTLLPNGEQRYVFHLKG